MKDVATGRRIRAIGAGVVKFEMAFLVSFQSSENAL